MQAQECTTEQIAAEMARRWGFRPRQAWRYAFGWTQEDVAAKFNQLIDDRDASMTAKRISDFEAWPIGGVKPTLTTLVVLAKLYGTSMSNLVDLHDRDSMNNQERVALNPTFHSIGSPAPRESGLGGDESGSVSLVGKQSGWLAPRLDSSSEPATQNQLGKRSLEQLVMAAAYESMHHAENAQGHAMPEATLDDMDLEVRRLTKEHLYIDPLTLFADTVQTRNRIFRLLELRQYPRQTEHLYYLAAIICALLGDTSANVGYPQAALEQIRASFAYAEIIGHNSLRIWCRTMQATLAYWGKRFGRALDLTRSASEWASESIGRVHLNNGIALFSALQSQKADSLAALGRAFDAHESAPGDSELFDGLGGMFSYSRAKLLQVSAITYLELDDVESAERSAAESVRLYETGPVDQRAYGNEASSRIDLGHARLLQGEIEGAEQAIQPVLRMPSAQRLDWVVLRIDDFADRLRRTGLAASVPGQELVSQIEEFREDTVKVGFPGIDK